jgi:ABC-type amino acid transport substrate-binding protein
MQTLILKRSGVMQKKIKNLSVTVFLFFLFCTQIYSAEKIKIGALHFPPFYVVESKDSVSGYYIDVLKTIFENAGLEYQFEGYPPKRLYIGVAEGLVDVWMGTRGVAVYEDKTIFVEEKIADIFLRCFSIGDTPEIKTKEDLKGKKIITILGYNYGGFISYLNDPENKIEQDPASSHELAFKKLKAGRANYLLDYKLPSETIIKDMDIPGLKWNDLQTIGIYISISKKSERSNEIYEKLKKSVSDLKKQGRL